MQAKLTIHHSTIHALLTYFAFAKFHQVENVQMMHTSFYKEDILFHKYSTSSVK